MAFKAKGLFRTSHVGSVGTGPGSVKSHWSYHDTDDAATVTTAGYFNSQVAQMVKGDVIVAVLDMDNTPLLRSYVVTAVTATVVTIAAGAM